MQNVQESLILSLLEEYNISPVNLDIYTKAFTHRSFNSQPGMNYERLEFLGDAVIKLILTEELLKIYPEATEGILAKKRAMFIQDRLLAIIAKNISLEKIIICRENEKINDLPSNPSVLADVLESLTAAIYLDQGLTKAKKFIQTLFKETIPNQNITDELTDNKTKLQEITQTFTPNLPVYTTIKENGPDHKKTFTVEATIVLNKKLYSATGSDKTKKIAEQKAAQLLIEKIQSLK